MTPEDVDYASRLTHAVLTSLGAPFDSWLILNTDLAIDDAPLPAGANTAEHMRITVGQSAGAADSVSVYFTAGLPRDQSAVATTEQLQDHAIEHAGGAALPSCPGHSHPLQARAINAEPWWVCPKEASHYARPILQQ